MKWAKRLLERGQTRGIGPDDLTAAVKGLPRVYRVRMPYDPCKVFCKRNASLWLEAMSAGRKLERYQPTMIGRVMADLAEAAARGKGAG